MAKKKAYSKSFFIELNMQNPPRPTFREWYVRKADSNSIPEYTIEGWEFTLDQKEDSIGKAEGSDPELNFRRAFLPEEGHYWVSRDFSGQELRILANLANEPVWIKTFLEGGDPHKATAIALWGEENYSKVKRKEAKAINFGLVYGKGAEGLADELGITVEEAQDYIDTFFKKLPKIKKYLDGCVRQATQNREISNIYGRKRRMHTQISSWGKLLGKGKRRSYNFPVQSMGAEVIKLALIKLYDGLISAEKYKGLVYFINTIHDEANFSIRFDVVKEVVKLAGDLMVHLMPGYPVPIITGLEIGHSMGLTWKFDQDPETLELTPVYESLDEEE